MMTLLINPEEHTECWYLCPFVCEAGLP